LADKPWAEICPEAIAAFERKHGKVKRRRTKGASPRKPRSPAEETFAQAWEEQRHPEPMVREHVFHPERKWRFDFAWPGKKVALECDGAQHGLIHELRKDNEKLAEAAILGWRVLRVLSADRRKVAEWVALVKRALG
jgi:very-short-patch-repair endonuclease